MSSHEFAAFGGVALLVLMILAGIVYVALWPWFILAAMRRMAEAQKAMAEAVTNGPGHKDVGESLDALQYQMGRIATAMERIALGDAAPPREPPQPPPPSESPAAHYVPVRKSPQKPGLVDTKGLVVVLLVLATLLALWWLLGPFIF